MRVVVLVVCVGLAWGDKWSSLKSSYLEKKARHRGLEESKEALGPKKKTGYEKEKVPVKINTKKYSKKKYADTQITTTEKYLKDERWQLCQTVNDDDVKNTLLKFGLVTHLFDEVTKFRKTMKTLQDHVPTQKKPKKGNQQKEIYLKDKQGSRVKTDQSNWVGRSFGGPLHFVLDSLPSIPLSSNFPHSSWKLGGESNYLGKHRRKRQLLYQKKLAGGKKARGRKGTLKVPGQVPQCYGWKYLNALDALLEDNTVDTEVLTQSVSDMLDMNFSQSVSSIIQQCGETLADNSPVNMCPPPSLDTEEPTCPNQCLVDTECQYREMCCRTSCGGYRCLPVRPPRTHSCEAGDQFMQCIYQMIDNQLCGVDGK